MFSLVTLLLFEIRSQMKLADMANRLTSELQESNGVYLHSVDIVGMGRCAWNSGLCFCGKRLTDQPITSNSCFLFCFLFFRQNLAM